MGLTKQYLRYEPVSVFNILASQKCNVLFVELNKTRNKYCAVAACEHVFIWDLKKGEKVAKLEGTKHEVTALAKSPDKRHLAVGYTDGTVKIFDMYSGDVAVTFSGHKTAVSALSYDAKGLRLVSGSKDTEVVLWDIINESGLFRLRGHKGMVTQARFLSKKNVLITSSKDTYVKFWDLDTQHCFKTLVGHKTEVWDFVVAKQETLLITGSGDMEIRVWHIDYSPQDEKEDIPKKKAKLDEEDTDSSDAEEELTSILGCKKLGSVQRQGKNHVATLGLDPTSRILACHGTDSLLEVFRISTDEEIRKKLQKKQKKARKRARETGQGDSVEDITESVDDYLKRDVTVKLSSKIRSFDCLLESKDKAKFISLLANNTLETTYLSKLNEKKSEVGTASKLSAPGHRTDVRTLTFSSDNTAILSASAESAKVWNRATQQCIRTVACDYALCSLFTPGDRHIVIGTKSGKLQVFELAGGVLLENIDAHKGAVWSIGLAPDKRSIVSGSADHDVKFWDFELITDQDFSPTSKRLTLVHTRTLKMDEDVLCVKYSPNHKLLAASLLDNTVKVFFADTLKFFLSLYGHKLPVLCMDISSDSSLIATGSADRNVKLWGLDFGDCHKSIFAHDDSIMCLQFIAKTHMFFTGGKDGKVKQWDGDTFDHIQTLEGHHSEVWSLAVSPSGNFVASASHDKSLRMWEKTHETLVLEEEKEMEREREYEEGMAQDEETTIAGETNKETGIAGKKTIETVKAAERLMEALDLYKEETAKLEEHEENCKAAGKQLADPPLHPMFQAFSVKTPLQYVLEVIKKIKSSELEESLLVLPFNFVIELLQLLNQFVELGWQTELSCRCLFFLLRVHQGQITSNQVLLPVLDKLKSNTNIRVNRVRDTIGFNLAAMRILKQQIEEKEQVTFFADATGRFKEKKKKEKKRAILAIKT